MGFTKLILFKLEERRVPLRPAHGFSEQGKVFTETVMIICLPMVSGTLMGWSSSARLRSWEVKLVAAWVSLKAGRIGKEGEEGGV